MALPVGRLSKLLSAIITAVVVNFIVGAIISIGIGVLNIESMDFKGSILYGASLGVIGLFFGGVGAIFSQLSSSNRGAIGLSLGTLGIAYLLRAFGDIGNETLSLISPLGLIQRTKVFTENNISPILILLGESIVVILLALLLNSIRDIGQGFIPQRKG